VCRRFSVSGRGTLTDASRHLEMDEPTIKSWLSDSGILLRNTWPQALCKRDPGEGRVGNRTWAVPE